MKLSDRLKALGVTVGTQNLKSAPPLPETEHPVENVLPGEIWHTPAGDAFVVETRYKADFQMGSAKIKPEASLKWVAAYANAPQLVDLPIEKFAFMDTETTGLGLGAGVYTFMVGIGRFEGAHFRLAQFFLRHPVEEAAQLAAIEQFLAPCEAWVSFNGKAFDLPLLHNRYTLHAQPIPLDGAAHIDLLHLSRRLWKARLPSRALGDLEHFILGAPRSQADIPGWMAPQLYRDYLHTGDARPLLGMFYHNEIDVLSLAALLSHIAALLNDPLHIPIEHGLDLLAIGKLYADLGDRTTAAKIYRRGLRYDNLQRQAYWQAIRELSFLHKRQGEIESACELWEQAAKEGQIYAHVELAKICEHRHRDYPAALHWIEQALEIIHTPAYTNGERTRHLPELEHRQERLIRKAGK